MTYHITKRGFVRIISFIIAAAIVVSVLIYSYWNQAQNSRRTLEYQYLQSIEALTQYSQNINNGLSKAMYAKTAPMLSMISSKLWREAALAKDALDRLPIEYLELQNTNKLLSQIGDYCVSLSKEFAEGKPITKEQRDILKSLSQYCEQMTSEIITMSDGIRTGALSLAKVENNLHSNMQEGAEVADITEGFSEFEEGFSAYPTLIYDGPFSDHIMQKEPERLKGEKDITREQAKLEAAKAAGINRDNLSDGTDENSKMPSYGFTGEGVDISITKKGGLVSYMLKSRIPEAVQIDAGEAMKKAKQYMHSLGVTSMVDSYYETANNIATFNFAFSQDGVVIYPDLIKISVALDNGEILGFDARGYIVNHMPRDLSGIAITEETARQSVSELLKPTDARLCLIPSDGLSEVLCYEFKCTAQDGKNVLVYVNAKTAAEEQILILLESENGTLTI